MIRHALRSYVFSRERDLAERRESAVRHHDHLKMCSCWMCGNPRRFGDGPPTQERRLNEAARYEVEMTDAVHRRPAWWRG
jgi:hypothetical protein